MSDYLCEELLVLTLKRLPVKTLWRFRSVCEWWKQLIDSESFILAHPSFQKRRLIAQSSRDEFLIPVDPHTIPPTTNTLTYPDYVRAQAENRQLEVVGALHGVMCLYNCANLFLWNPLIHRFLHIPPPPPLGLGCSIHGDRLSFGFWIDPSTKHFKLVILKSRAEPRNTEVWLFSSTRPRWTEADTSNIQGLGYTPGFGRPHVLIDGVDHWRAYRLQGTTRQRDKRIAFFDFVREKFGMLELPEAMRFDCMRHTYDVCKWRDSVSILHWLEGSPVYRRGDLWAMQNGSWVKMLSFKPVINSPVLCVVESQGKVLVLSTRSNNAHHHGELVLFDPNDAVGSCFHLVHLDNKFSCDILSGYEFVESLVFPDPKCISSDE